MDASEARRGHPMTRGPMGKATLSAAQRRALEQVQDRNGYYTAWTLGTSTSEALRRRGLVEGEVPFTGRFRNDPPLRITPAGRALLETSDDR